MIVLLRGKLMTVRIAINGYGRIGRNALRALYESGRKDELEIVAINDLGSAEINAHLIRFEPLQGQPSGTYARVSAWEPDTTRRIDSFAVSLSGVRRVGGYDHQLFLGIDDYRETLNQPALAVPSSTSPPINIFLPVYGLVTAPPQGSLLQRTLTTQDLKAKAASLQDQVDIGKWSLVGGLRYTDQDFRYGTAGVQPVREENWSPKLGILYQPGTQETIYGSFAKGLAPNQIASSSNQSLPSRRSSQAELGWKSLWLSGSLSSDIALYELKQTNMISANQDTPAHKFDLRLTAARGLEASKPRQAAKSANRLTSR